MDFERQNLDLNLNTSSRRWLGPKVKSLMVPPEPLGQNATHFLGCV
jgi:hypothetical protein